MESDSQKKWPFELVNLRINFHSGLTNLSQNELTKSVRAIMNQHLTRYFQRCLSVKLFLCTKISWNLNYWLVVERLREVCASFVKAISIICDYYLFLIDPFWEDIKRIVLISWFGVMTTSHFSATHISCGVQSINGLRSQIRQKQRDIIVSGCLCSYATSSLWIMRHVQWFS